MIPNCVQMAFVIFSEIPPKILPEILCRIHLKNPIAYLKNSFNCVFWKIFQEFQRFEKIGSSSRDSLTKSSIDYFINSYIVSSEKSSQRFFWPPSEILPPEILIKNAIFVFQLYLLHFWIVPQILLQLFIQYLTNI